MRKPLLAAQRGRVEETVTNSRAGTVKARRRAKLAPDDQANFVGFRVARNLPDDSVASYESY